MSQTTQQTINKSLELFISRFDEIYGIIISDSDGCVFARVLRHDAPTYLPLFPVQLDVSRTAQAGQPTLLMSVDPISVGFAKNIPLIDKLAIGRVNMTTSVYSCFISFQIWMDPLIITLITTVEMNRGVVYSIIPELKEKLEDIRTELITTKDINYSDH